MNAHTHGGTDAPECTTCDATPGPSTEFTAAKAAWEYQYERARDAEAEVERLTRWKAEALPVLDGLQELGQALSLPLGERITGPRAVEAVKRLRAKVERLTTALAEADERIGGMRASVSKWRKFANRDYQRADKAEDALAEARAVATTAADLARASRQALADLRARIAALADEALSIAADAVRSQGEPDEDIADATLRSLSRRSKAVSDDLREMLAEGGA